MRFLIIILFLYAFTPLVGQDSYQTTCNHLIQTAFHDPFDFEKIDAALDKTIIKLNESDYAELNAFNCVDSVWVANLKDMRRFTKYTHSTKRDTAGCLRSLSAKLDIAQLNHELKFQEISRLPDSLNYVLEKIILKKTKRQTPPNNWMTFYHCIDAEAKFLKEHVSILKEKYWEIFDNKENNEAIREMMLLSMPHANKTIEDEVLTRLPNNIDELYFYRMLGILMYSGTEKSMNQLIQLMDTNEFSLNKKKAILQTIYKISDRIKVKRKTRKNFENYLSSTGLDSLSRYDLFIKE